MADAPEWGFAGLGSATRWVMGHGLPTTAAAPQAPLGDDDWSRLTQECNAHRLDGHLIAAVVDGALPTTADQRADAAAIELRLTRARSRYDDVCRPVLDDLADAGILVRLLKGSALPWSDYPDPQLRPTADLDLLVPSRQLQQAVDLLVGQGAVPVNPEPTAGFARSVFKGLTVRMPSGLEVDLHRILSWGPLGVRVPEADLWAPGRTFDRLGHRAVTLDVDRTLLHLCAHLLLLGALRASEVRDVAQLALSPSLDPERVVAIARRWGHEAILAVALRMVERELAIGPADLPLAEWAANHRVRRTDRAWLRTDRPDAPVAGIEPLAVLLELPGWQPRLTMLRALAFPRPGTDPGPTSRLRRLVQTRIIRSRRASKRSDEGTASNPTPLN